MYTASAIIQTQSYSLQSANSSRSTVLDSLQIFLTQILSVYMLHTLFTRQSPASSLGWGHYVWFSVASLLPVTALATQSIRPGISALMSYLGTAITGFLQVLLVVSLGERPESEGASGELRDA
jgi:hypothetical protein